MPYALTHFLFAIVVLETWIYFFIKGKKVFPSHYLILVGLAALLPDLDIAVDYLLVTLGIFSKSFHRTYLHTLFFPLIFLFLGFLFYGFKNKELGAHHLRLRNILFIISLGWLLHLFLDATIAGGIMPFYPITSYSMGLNLINFLPQPLKEYFLPTLDAALLVLWVVYLEIKHKAGDIV